MTPPVITAEELTAMVRYAGKTAAECGKPHRPADSPCSCGWVTWAGRPPADNTAVLSLFRKLCPEPNGKHVPRVLPEGAADTIRTGDLLAVIAASSLRAP